MRCPSSQIGDGRRTEMVAVTLQSTFSSPLSLPPPPHRSPTIVITQFKNCMLLNQCCGSGAESGSISQRYGSVSGSFYHHAKIVRKTLIPTIL
jgi:hypothetical protein